MTARDHPTSRHLLTQAPLAARSTAGLPLANGQLGALVWHDQDDLILSIDRADLWDLRPVPEFSGPNYSNEALADLVDHGSAAEILARFEAPYRRAAPTKLPSGRIRVAAPPQSGVLRLDRAAAEITAEGDHIGAVVHATREFGLVWGSGACPAIALEPPAFGEPVPVRDPNPVSPFGPEDLDYTRPRRIIRDDASGYVQSQPDGRAFCGLITWRSGPEGWRSAWTVVLAASDAAAEVLARTILEAAVDAPVDELLAEHHAWWNDYWAKVSLTLPDALLERQWALDAYKFGAAARRGCPPVALQAQWTSDNGRLPPWKGDYHHDLNTQMTYWPALTGNRLEAHAGFLDWLWETRDACRQWTSAFFGVEGLNVPMTADLLNRQLGGWAPYTHSATTGAWLAHHFAEHWRMSGNNAFLAERGYPYVAECAQFIDALTRRDALNGRRRLRLSSSPEIGDNRLEAWFPDWSNYDLALCRALLMNAARMAAALGLGTEADRWTSVLIELPDPALDEEGGFAVAPGVPFATSHRHFSHQLALHPLGLVEPIEPRVAPTIAAIDAAGTDMWMGYSFAWSAALHAFAGDGEKAAERIHQFARGFCGPNSFHTNGEVGGEGLTRFAFDAFTLEGNCAAMAAVQDMLLQSRGGRIDLFPAVPSHWGHASFSGLLSEGGIVVDAQLQPRAVEVTLRSPTSAKRCISVRRGAPQQVQLCAGVPLQLRIEL